MTRNQNNRRRGSTVLDAALVFPILLSLTFGCIEFGHYFYIKHTLQGAAREGARAAATGTTDTEVRNAVKASMDAAGIPAAKYTTTITDTAGTNIIVTGTNPIPGTAIVVKVTANWGVVGIRPMRLIGDTKSVIGSTTMRREG